MNQIDNAEEQHSEQNKALKKLWLSGIVGIALGILLLGAIDISVIRLNTTTIIVAIVLLAVVVAIAFFWKGTPGVIVVRWCARSVAIPLALLFTMIFVEARFTGFETTNIGMTILGWIFLLVRLALDAGIVFTFFREGIGGAIVAFAALALTVVDLAMGGGMTPIFGVFLLYGPASIYCWWRTKLQISISQSGSMSASG